MPYHIVITPKPKGRPDAIAVDKNEAWIEERIALPWRCADALFIDGWTLAPEDIDRIRITETPQTTKQMQLDIMKVPGVTAPRDRDIARSGHDVTDQFIKGAPGTVRLVAADPNTAFASNRKAVMVIYGHDQEARTALFNWLRMIGLQPQEWNQLVTNSGAASPYVGDVLARAFKDAQAVVALFTPDERVRGRGSLPAADHTWRLQARPNVLIEAGMALVTHPTRTVLAMLGPQELPSDLAGRHYVRLSPTSPQPLHDLASRLQAAGCDVNLSGSQWLDAASFPNRDEISPRPPATA